jgi:cbb3-type cytochrome oxidase maturation protein
MAIIFFLIGCSLLLGLVFLVAFLWSVRSGQYKDVETPALRVLFEEKISQPQNDKLVDK